MKNETLQQLLAKYQQGTLSQEELERLNQLTHKAEVLDAAEGRARTIIRRRTMRTVAFVCAGMAVLGTGVWVMKPTEETPLMAEVKNESRPEVVENVVVAEPEPVVHQMVAHKVERKTERVQEPKDPVAVPEEIALPQNEEPTVICNNQCDADSVISDIWKFLTA